MLVTGAGSGIGAGIAEVLALDGWHVLVNDIDAELATRTADAIGGTALPGDVAAAPEALVDAARGPGLRPLDALVNNAGIHRRAALVDIEPHHLDDVYRVNLRAPILAARAFVSQLGGRPGAVVNISSIAAVTPQMGVGLYTATKAAIGSFTAQAAVEWGPLGVRVNAVAPGMVRTAMAEAVYADPDLHERRRAMVPVGRIGTPRDIGHACSFLLSDRAGYVSGQTLVVDGGFSNVLIDQLPHPAPPAP